MSDISTEHVSASRPSARRFPRGSEWRKWDLHIHAPGTKLNNKYGTPADIDKFCHLVEASDVVAFGITDYFSVDNFYLIKERYNHLYPRSQKVLFPNIELRLNESVNGQFQHVNIHLLLREDTPQYQSSKLLSELKTQITEATDRNYRCSELSNTAHYQTATVTRADIKQAIEETFGRGATRTDHVLIIVPANNDGIRANGVRRNANLADQIDKLCDAIYGNSRNVDYFLKTDRCEDRTQISKPKPVFAASDAHSFQELQDWLGRNVNSEGTQKEVTWIKADPTFEGLQQTLIEPAERVRIQPSQPDAKEPYKVIAAVHFDDPQFPKKIILNPNLVSIIGTRSAGKSSLLAYISNTVDHEYTVAQQVASGLMEEKNAGPAAGKTWSQVSNISCKVEWADAAVQEGKVIYIPQNSLFAVSERPEEITQKIQPALFRLYPALQVANHRMLADVTATKTAITQAVAQWFRTDDRIAVMRKEIRDLGDPQAIEATRKSLMAELEALRASSELSPEDIAAYQSLTDELGTKQSRLTAVRGETTALSPFITQTDGRCESTGVSVNITLTPDPSAFPRDLERQVLELISSASATLNTSIQAAVKSYQITLNKEDHHLVDEQGKLLGDNTQLIAKNRANVELELLVTNHKKQEELLKLIADRQRSLDSLIDTQGAQAEEIKNQIELRSRHISDFAKEFNSAPRILDNMTFGIEHQVTGEGLEALSRHFNRQSISSYFDRSSETIKIDQIFANPSDFLKSLRDGSQKLRSGYEPVSVASLTLTMTPEVRFIATLEGDRIGGFERSSMTPGKQSLFALSLILNESIEPWPLLIDQPEDDLDSRSIYGAIVPYLAQRKRDRQILMVSRDANLVVGADSEQVIVANRHGDDRKNRDNREFEYLTGSLEHSLSEEKTDYVLEKYGIREHACEILDGGAEAFQKRRDKYKI